MGAARGRVGRGMKSIKGIENRVNDLISAAQSGNKSIEIRNELDSHLSTLINTKKVKPKVRDEIMMKLYGKNK